MKQDCGLAHAGLGDEAQESTISFDPVIQRGERFPMGSAEIQESRVRGYAERLFPQSEIFLIHASLLRFQRIAALTAHPPKKHGPPPQPATLVISAQARADELEAKSSSGRSIRR